MQLIDSNLEKIDTREINGIGVFNRFFIDELIEKYKFFVVDMDQKKNPNQCDKNGGCAGRALCESCS
jgi:hypothetical protein